MATFVHLTTASSIAAIKRGGLKASRLENEATARKGVFCCPVQMSFFATHQWLRELRRRRSETLCGVYFRIPDSEIVYAGRFNKLHRMMKAVEALGSGGSADAKGWQVIIPRSITRAEILKIKRLPQVVGWRVYPEAKGINPVWPQPGDFGAKNLRIRLTSTDERDRDHYFSRFPKKWYSDHGG